MSNAEGSAAQRKIRKVFGTLVRDDFSPIATKSRTRREDLITVWRELGYKVGAEIGVQLGKFSEYIVKNAPSVTLYCIDPWDVYDKSKATLESQTRNYEQTVARLAPYIAQRKVYLLKNKSLDAVKEFANGELDFVFVDGHHIFDACVMDIIAWSPKVKIGGMIAVHDYCPMRHSGVMEAVNAYTKCHSIHPWYVIRGDLPTAFWIKEHE